MNIQRQPAWSSTPDDWRWGAQEHYSWREHEGRGYWNGDKWMDR